MVVDECPVMVMAIFCVHKKSPVICDAVMPSNEANLLFVSIGTCQTWGMFESKPKTKPKTKPAISACVIAECCDNVGSPRRRLKYGGVTVRRSQIGWFPSPFLEVSTISSHQFSVSLLLFGAETYQPAIHV